MWKYLKSTQNFIKILEEEKLKAVKEVSLNCGVMYQENSMKEYYRYMGYIQSLDKVLKLIDEVKDEQ